MEVEQLQQRITTQKQTIQAYRDESREWREVAERAQTENDKLRDLMYERAHVYAIQNMTEDELRITATNVMDDNAKLRELALGLGQCAQGVDCEDCLLHDLTEPDHCREERLSRELELEVEE